MANVRVCIYTAVCTTFNANQSQTKDRQGRFVVYFIIIIIYTRYICRCRVLVYGCTIKIIIDRLLLLFGPILNECTNVIMQEEFRVSWFIQLVIWVTVCCCSLVRSVMGFENLSYNHDVIERRRQYDGRCRLFTYLCLLS